VPFDASTNSTWKLIVAEFVLAVEANTAEEKFKS
jgi:hypothetical protein